MIATANAANIPGDATPSKLCEDALAVRRALTLIVLALVALLPWALFGVRAGVAANAADLRIQLGIGWAMGATVWIPQLWLVEPRVATIRPVLRAAAAIALGALAGGVPALVLLVLFALTAREGSPAASAAVVRAHWKPVAVAAGALLAVDLLAPLVLQLALVHVPAKKPPVAAFAVGRTYLRALAAVLVVWSPIAATLVRRSRRS